MDNDPQGSSAPKKIVMTGFYIAGAACIILLFGLLEITDDNPNFDRIGFISALVVFVIGVATLAISMGLMTYGLENKSEVPMVRVAAILAATYLFAQFLADYNPLSMASNLLGDLF